MARKNEIVASGDIPAKAEFAAPVFVPKETVSNKILPKLPNRVSSSNGPLSTAVAIIIRVPKPITLLQELLFLFLFPLIEHRLWERRVE